MNRKFHKFKVYVAIYCNYSYLQDLAVNCIIYACTRGAGAEQGAFIIGLIEHTDNYNYRKHPTYAEKKRVVNSSQNKLYVEKNMLVYILHK